MYIWKLCISVIILLISQKLENIRAKKQEEPPHNEISVEDTDGGEGLHKAFFK